MAKLKTIVIMLFASILFTVGASAYVIEVDHIRYKVLSQTDNTVEIYGYDVRSDIQNVVIPATFTYKDIEYSVVSMHENAFSKCKTLVEITLPSTIKEISDGAFYGCESLKTILLPDMLVSIGESAFERCNNLTSISLPPSLTTIGKNAFCMCGNLTGISIPDSIVDISDRTFYECKNLASISLPASLIKIGDAAFYECDNLTDISIPNSVQTIGAAAFAWCKSLQNVNFDIEESNLTSIGTSAFAFAGFTEISLPKSLRIIGDSVFSASSLQTITMSEEMEEIEESAFAFSDITTIVLPNSVKTIGKGAFKFCSDLISVTLPQSLETIGNLCFMDCVKLSSINIPQSMTYQEDVFNGCISLVDFNVDPANEYYTADGPILYNKDKTILVAYPSAKECVAIDVDIQTIATRAFSKSGISSVILPSSLKLIQTNAFYNCDKLSEIVCYAGTPPTMESYALMMEHVTSKNIEVINIPLTVYVPQEAVDLYKADPKWKEFSIKAIDPNHVGEIVIDNPNAELQSDMQIYTLDGKRLSPCSLEELPRGIYIINGQKILLGK